MKQAEKMCANVCADIKPQAVTLADAVLAMQKKIEQQIPIYEQMPLAQQVTVGTGEKMLRQNPAVQEFRATVRDYAASLNNLQGILENHSTAETVASPRDGSVSRTRRRTEPPRSSTAQRASLPRVSQRMTSSPGFARR